MAIPYSDVKLGRTEKGKPVLENQVTDPRLKSFSFNISHQGDFTVLAAEQCRQVGIDVMKTVYPSGTDVPGFFQLMRKQFTPAEWLTVKSEKTEWEQLEMFYRHWCLKESYVKAVGVGIGHDLQAIEFNLQTQKLSKQMITCDSALCLNGQKVDNWTFEETKLDDLHQVAVAVGPITSETISRFEKTEFQILTFSELISNAVSIRHISEDEWETFGLKRETRVR
ncbi:L-aminoadipate-semialdehyde dehydrogenase-phosphopantetheinyl transferase [Exaiptasia diaphana]|nr:L-aminoadipate-semialdehyde dehydrogenase-phosphopantetheinyl transferase [Exaiptasia diaphana]